MADIRSLQRMELTGGGLDIAKMPGHSLLARLGKPRPTPGEASR